MEIKVVRMYGDAFSTNGKMFIHGIPFCETMESPKHGNLHNCCVAPGKYKLRITSNEFSSFCPVLIKADKFKEAVVRPGESCREARGNILVGEIYTGDNHLLVGSTMVFARLTNIIKEAYLYGDRRFWLTIEESPDFEYEENGFFYVPKMKEDGYGTRC
ncbi:MAG: DUF5675 family protein [Bacteroides sp.]|nr:DUF5675 family protein [Roseburia sp.]MCM1346158.1 DUF5675 family protein [Bacteroides sp.]MCM1420961.1 DUF5675 family protein [Bacteroides sp.]